MSFSAKGIVHRSTVTGRRGMIASAHPLASLAGVRIMMEGGNAMQIAQRATVESIRDVRRSGLAKVGRGLVSLEELNRITAD